jgi:hypothetical protein
MQFVIINNFKAQSYALELILTTKQEFQSFFELNKNIETVGALSKISKKFSKLLIVIANRSMSCKCVMLCYILTT